LLSAGRLHIGLVSNPGWPADQYPNGIVAYVHQLRAELMNQGHRVSVFAGVIGQKNKDAGIYLVKDTVEYRILHALNRMRGRQASHPFLYGGRVIAANIMAVHRTEPIDVVEIDEGFGWCAELAERVPMPVVVRLHGPAFLTLMGEARASEMGRNRIEAEGRALRRASVIVAPSHSTLRDTVSHYGLAPRLQKVIPNPVTVNADIPRWTLDGCDRKTILFIGRWDYLKGGDMVLAAFRRLLEVDSALKLIFVGPDRGLQPPGSTRRTGFAEFRDQMFPQAQRASISYLGQVPRNDVFSLRTKAMVTLVASRWENQPNTVLEAMMQGCPLVAVDAGGVGELIQHGVTGLLAPRDNVDEFQRMVQQMLAEPEKARQMGESASRFVAERHAVQTVCAQIVALYRQAKRDRRLKV